MIRTPALAALAAALLVLSGCSGDGDPARAPAATAAASVPSRVALDAVAKAVNLRPADLPRTFVEEPVPSGTLEVGRANDRFARCLGLGEPFGAFALPSTSLRSAEAVPLVDWSTAVSAHDRAALTKAVRAFGTAAGPRCLTPLVQAVLRISADGQDGITARGLRVVSLPVTRGPVDAAGGARATATLQGPTSSQQFSVDVVLLADDGFGVSLHGFGFDQLPSAEQRDRLVSALTRRLGAAAS